MITFDEFWDDVITYDLEIQYKFHEYKNNFKHANGCGAKDGIKFPDTIYGVPIVAACIIHDIDWYLAKKYSDLEEGNESFDNNLKKIIDCESMNDFMRWLRRSRIHKYVDGVELVGTEDYAEKRGFI